MNAPNKPGLWSRLKPSIDRFGGVHLFEPRPPERYAADLDDAERLALRERDATVEAHAMRWALVALGFPFALFALALFLPGKIPPALFALYGMVPGYMLCITSWSLCPNCRRRPDRCVDFCPACGARAIVPGFSRIPECTACGRVLQTFRGASIAPRGFCSSCGLRLGRRERPVAWWFDRRRSRG